MLPLSTPSQLPSFDASLSAFFSPTYHSLHTTQMEAPEEWRNTSLPISEEERTRFQRFRQESIRRVTAFRAGQMPEEPPPPETGQSNQNVCAHVKCQVIRGSPMAGKGRWATHGDGRLCHPCGIQSLHFISSYEHI